MVFPLHARSRIPLRGLNLSVQFSRLFTITFMSRTLERTRPMDKQDLNTSKVIPNQTVSGRAMAQPVRFSFRNPPIGFL
jgi:hypothetical protein